jgi:hypothetical protein
MSPSLHHAHHTSTPWKVFPRSPSPPPRCHHPSRLRRLSEEVPRGHHPVRSLCSQPRSPSRPCRRRHHRSDPRAPLGRENVHENRARPAKKSLQPHPSGLLVPDRHHPFINQYNPRRGSSIGRACGSYDSKEINLKVVGSSPTFGYSYHSSSLEQLFFLSFAAWYARCVALLSFGGQDDGLRVFCVLLWYRLWGGFALELVRAAALRRVFCARAMHSCRDQGCLWFCGHHLDGYLLMRRHTVFLYLDLSPAFVGDPKKPDPQWFNACNLNLHPHLLA